MNIMIMVTECNNLYDPEANYDGLVPILPTMLQY
jgi:hypothetical protein